MSRASALSTLFAAGRPAWDGLVRLGPWLNAPATPQPSAFDDAIQAHLAHPAASGCDPLTDSLADQALPYTLRAGWEHEPIAVPLPWRWAALAFVLTVLVFTFTGCGGNPCDETDPGHKDTGPVDCRANPELCR